MTFPIVKAEGGWTAGPWALDKYGTVVDPDGEILYANGFATVCNAGAGMDEAKANAARIVYAVNNIDDREARIDYLSQALQATDARANASAQQVSEKDARIAGLEAALCSARPYVVSAYECAFPDLDENSYVLRQIDAALEGSKPE